MARPSWDRYFMDIAKLAATRATCDRAHVGCVIVRDNRVLSTGYNGSLPGAPHCDEAGHLMIDNHCARTNHAEVNAIAQAAISGTALAYTTAYVTHKPCLPCARALVAAGIRTIYYETVYGVQDYGTLRPYIHAIQLSEYV